MANFPIMPKDDYKNWSRDDLIEEVKRLRKQKKYGLVWEDKPEDVVERCKLELPVLEEVKSKEIKTDPDKPVNLLIEGDNYHALSVLNYTHQRKIDVIYIDPPYNTGAKDWKYNNHYVDENDTFRHSKWLSFMHHRLVLAKKLLSKRGVFICAIDHNEQEALGLMLQEIFPGREITCVTIIHNPGGIQGNNFSYTHEYAYFVYPKINRIIALENRSENADIRPLRDVSKGNHLREDAKNCFYPIYIKDKKIIGFGDVCDNSFHPSNVNIKKRDGVIEVYPIDTQGKERKWVFSRQNVENIKNELEARYNKKRKIWDVIRIKKNFNYKTVWTDSKFNSNIFGSKLLNKILSDKFPFPKSLYNTQECLRATSINNPDATILDYFAGSGTTGHAVLELNNQDNGNRKFILCTNNENKIASNACYPRIKKIIKGYEITKKEKIKGLGGNLKYLRTSFVPGSSTDKNRTMLTEKATEMLCTREDTFEPVKDAKQFKIFKGRDHHTGIIFDQTAIDKFKQAISKIDSKFRVYIFSLGDDTFDDRFSDMKDKITISPIPESILRVYRRIFQNIS